MAQLVPDGFRRRLDVDMVDLEKLRFLDDALEHEWFPPSCTASAGPSEVPLSNAGTTSRRNSCVECRPCAGFARLAQRSSPDPRLTAARAHLAQAGTTRALGRGSP